MLTQQDMFNYGFQVCGNLLKCSAMLAQKRAVSTMDSRYAEAYCVNRWFHMCEVHENVDNARSKWGMPSNRQKRL